MERVTSSGLAPAEQRESLGRWVFAALLIGVIPQGLVEAAITASLPEMSRDLGANGEFVAQMMMGMGALGLTVGALISGRILEWAGTRYTFVGALFTFGAFGALGMVVGDPRLLFATRVIVGIAASCLVTTCLWGISANFSGAQRARVFSAAGAIGGVSILLSIVFGGFLTQHFGWRSSFIQYPLFALIALPIGLVGIEQRRPDVSGSNRTSYLKRLVPLYLLVVIFYAVVGMSSMQLPFLLNANGASEAGLRSLIQSLPGIAAILGAFSYGAVQHRIGSSWSFAAALGFFASGLAILAATHGLILPAAGACAVGICMGLSGPYFYHTVTEQTSLGSAGRYIGYVNACTYFGAFLNPLVFTPVKANLGMQGMFYVGAFIIVAVGIAMLRKAIRSAPLPREQVH